MLVAITVFSLLSIFYYSRESPPSEVAVVANDMETEQCDADDEPLVPEE